MTGAPVDWQSSERSVLLNPRTPDAERASLLAAVDGARELAGHVFLVTSGTTASATGALKWVALSKQAILRSARAVNDRISSGPHDRWLHCLPDFHIGGLSIHARAHLSGARIDRFSSAWEARAFHAECERLGSTLCSLVPAQLHDLVAQGLRSPERLRVVFVGGGALEPALWYKARKLGWRILPTYGMSEASSQVATAQLEDCEDEEYPSLRVLPHLEVDASEDGRIRIRGESLLTAYVVTDFGGGHIDDPKRDGWFLTDDRGCCEAGVLQMTGRTQDLIKIGGENSDLARLSRILSEQALRLGLVGDCAIWAAEDERLGRVIHLVVTGEEGGLIEAFNSRVFPFERIRQVRRLSSIPRTELGKLKRAELRALL